MVTLTEMAAKKVADLRLEKVSPSGGCAFASSAGAAPACRTSSWEDQQAEGDTVVESHGVKVFVDPHSVAYLQGSEIDYVDNNMLGAGFAINNPNVKSSCGCGQSHRF